MGRDNYEAELPNVPAWYLALLSFPIAILMAVFANLALG